MLQRVSHPPSDADYVIMMLSICGIWQSTEHIAQAMVDLLDDVLQWRRGIHTYSIDK